MTEAVSWIKGIRAGANFTLKAAVIITMVGVPYAAFLMGSDVPDKLWDFAVGAAIAAGGFALRDAAK